MTDVCLLGGPKKRRLRDSIWAECQTVNLPQECAVVMPSSLLLMSGTLPTEVFKILPVVHSRVSAGSRGGGGRGGEEGYVCKNDGQQLLEKILLRRDFIKGQCKWINGLIRAVTTLPGVRSPFQKF